MRFTGLFGVGALALATVACGAPNGAVPASETAPSIDAPTSTGAPRAASTTISQGSSVEASASATTGRPTDAGPLGDERPAEPAPCITSGRPRTVPGTAVPAFEVDAAEEPAAEEVATGEPAAGPSGTLPPGSTAGGPEVPADPLTLPWLAPVEPPCGLALVEARRELAAPCGPTDDCDLTMPQATLRYRSADPAVFRHVELVQQLGNASAGADYDDPGEVVTLAGREVTIHTTEDELTTAIWAEPLGTVTAPALSITLEELGEFIASLAPYEPAEWPGDEVDVPEPICVDDTTRYAPTALPEGWQRFVLDIAPDGACDVAPFLFMSLVVPGTEAAPGTLVTFVIGPSGGALPAGDGDVTMVGDHPAALWTATDPVRGEVSTVVFEIGDVVIDAHGDADVATLIALAESVELVDIATWEQLAAELQAPG